MHKILLLNLILCFSLTTWGNCDVPPDISTGGGKGNISVFTPDNFCFLEAASYELAVEVSSNKIILSGLSWDTPISIENGLYSINGAAPVTDASTVITGDTVNVFLTTSADYQTTTTATLTVGTLAVDFNATTRKKDTKPSYIVPTSVTGAAVNSYVLANDITFTEFDGDDITIMGTEYKINEGDWTAPGTATINENDVMSLRVLSSSNYSTQVTSSVNGSGWFFEFNVTTLEGIIPTVIFNKAFEEDGSTPLNGSEELVLTFSQTMQIDTLNLSGDMVPDCNDLADDTSCLNLVWSENDTVLTISPKEDFYWYSDVRALQVAIIGDGILGLDETVSATVLPVFETFQAADVWVGQYNSSASNYKNSIGINEPTGVSVNTQGDNAVLLVTDIRHRALKYDPVPTIGTVLPDFFGQNSIGFNSTGNGSDELDGPTSIVELDNRIYIAEKTNNRAIWIENSNFSAEGTEITSGHATSLVGQHDFGSSSYGPFRCEKNRLDNVRGMDVVKTSNGIQWIVADRNNHRVMIWANPEEAIGNEADLVLGQSEFNVCDNKSPNNHGLGGMRFPRDIWSNGERLITLLGVDSRLLVWNEFPTENNQIADFQLGQIDNTSSGDNAGEEATNQRGLRSPQGMGGNDYQLCVADSENHRVLIWSELPNSSEDLADIVIGQSDFSKGFQNDVLQEGKHFGSASDRVMFYPQDCDMSMEQLFIADTYNNRVLIFNALNKRPTNN